MTCNPTVSSPLAAKSGMFAWGRPKLVQLLMKSDDPVAFRPSGATTGQLIPRIASNEDNASSTEYVLRCMRVLAANSSLHDSAAARENIASSSMLN